MAFGSYQTRRSPLERLLAPWAGLRPDFLWIPTSLDMALQDRAKGLRGTAIGGAIPATGGVANPTANSNGYISFPTTLGIGASGDFIGMAIVSVLDPTSVTGSYIDIGGSVNGIGFGAGNTTFENVGAKIILLRENLAWEVSAANAWISGCQVVSFGKTNQSVNVNRNETTGVEPTSTAAWNAPNSYIGINGYTTSRGSNIKVHAVAIWNKSLNNADWVAYRTARYNELKIIDRMPRDGVDQLARQQSRPLYFFSTGAGGTDATATGAVNTGTASVIAGSATASSAATAATVTATASIITGTATAASAASAATVSATASAIPGSASGGTSASAGSAMVSATASPVVGSATAASQAVAATVSVTASTLAGSATGTASGAADGVTVSATASAVVGSATAASSVTAATVTATASAIRGNAGPAQFMRPSADISSGGWQASTGTDLYAMLDEATLDSADYIYSPNNPTTETFEVKLSSIDDPAVSEGHTLRVGLQAINATTNFDLAIVQGSTVLDSWTEQVTVADGEAVRSRALAPAVIAAITDYADVRFRGTARA